MQCLYTAMIVQQSTRPREREKDEPFSGTSFKSFYLVQNMNLPTYVPVPAVYCKYCFIDSRWLDVQEDDGHIERELDVSAGRFVTLLLHWSHDITIIDTYYHGMF